jgi:branched-chain amino acid transport system permease protein
MANQSSLVSTVPVPVKVPGGAASAPGLRSPRVWFVAVVLLLLAAVPVYSQVYDRPFYLTSVARIMVFGLAALSLALMLGYAGLVSFGHALYLGLGAYSVGIMSFYGITNGWAHLGVTLGASALVAVLTGLVCLRTSGIGFIMITLAFAQMFFFLIMSLKVYGGDDGLPIAGRSDFGVLDLQDNVVFYYVVFALVVAVLYGAHRLVNSPFGMVLRGCKSNERRMRALGFPTLRYKLAAYVISSMICGVAGLLLANLTKFASPEYMSWVRSGDLIVMIVIGGMNSLFGAVVGAMVLLLLEELLMSITEHWMAILGLLILLMVLVAKHGVYGSLLHWEKRRAQR